MPRFYLSFGIIYGEPVCAYVDVYPLDKLNFNVFS